jgi:hypothetical protein
MSRTVQLNGKDLMLSESGDVPALSGVAWPKGFARFNRRREKE